MEALQVIEAVDDVIEIHVKVLRLEIMMSIVFRKTGEKLQYSY